jgi:hypothetical protein
MVPQFTPFGTDRAYLLGRKLLADDRTTQGTVTSDPRRQQWRFTDTTPALAWQLPRGAQAWSSTS